MSLNALIACIGVLAAFAAGWALCSFMNSARCCTDEFEQGESLRRRHERLLTHPEVDQAKDIRGCSW